MHWKRPRPVSTMDFDRRLEYVCTYEILEYLLYIHISVQAFIQWGHISIAQLLRHIANRGLYLKQFLFATGEALVGSEEKQGGMTLYWKVKVESRLRCIGLYQFRAILSSISSSGGGGRIESSTMQSDGLEIGTNLSFGVAG